ncbi:hypothetical protein ACG33_09785 [Steroidobacter denitrificans]|uniref:TonB-dependent receptor n=2 Tax=Steroidobacter denitrificans TaxID=465721 RepID=A0A127FAD3_STEDE|nr:hypothetical protein ACG33_09785 [Steroidobacter denitrificans]
MAAQAQTSIPAGSAGSAVLEEIVVTAERRETALQDTPISLAVMGVDQIKAIGAFEIRNISDQIPNVRINSVAGSQSNIGIGIRGVSATDTQLAMDPAVGIYLDGVYIGRHTGAVFDIVDLERIEVLRGPQGTLYGRNSTGGTINLVTRRPGDELAFAQTLTYGSEDFLRSTTRVNLPLSEQLAASLSYNHTQRDGYVDSLYSGKDLGGFKSDAARLALRWTPGERFTADYAFDWSQRQANNAFAQLVHVRPLQINLGGRFYEQLAAVSSPRRMQRLPLIQDSDDENSSHVYGHALTLEWRPTADLSVKSISSYRAWKENERGSSFGDVVAEADTVLNGSTGTYIPAGEWVSSFYSTRRDDQDQWSQELQLLGSAFEDRLTYTLGAYYFSEDGKEFNPTAYVLPAQFAFGSQPPATQGFLCADFVSATPCLGKSVRLGNPVFRYAVDNEAYALYGQATWGINDAVDFTLGGRWSRDRRSATLTTLFGGIQETVAGSKSWSDFSPSGNLSWKIRDGLNTYFKVSSAYRSGGFNARATTVASFLSPVDAETVVAYELGLKSEFWDRRARFNVALFDMDYKDRQVKQFEAGTGGSSQRFVNAGKSSARGVEMDFTVLPVEGLELRLSYGYLDVKYDEYITAISDPVTGLGTGVTADVSASASTLVHAPEHTGAASAEYTFPLTSYGTWALWAGATYASHRDFDPLLYLYTATPAHTLIDARLTLRDIPLQKGNLLVALWSRNLANKKVREWSIDFGTMGWAISTFGPERTFGIEAGYQF